MAKVSVIVVTYNRASLLRRTLLSMSCQSLREFELIIADDCSNDETEKLCKDFCQADPRMRYVRRAQNLGMPLNLQLAIQEATGDYLAILHDDDIYAPDLLLKWQSALDAYPNAAFVFNAYCCVDQAGNAKRVFRECLPPVFSGKHLLEKGFFRRWRFTSPVWGCAMVRRSALERVGSLDARFGFYADVDLWMRLADCYYVAYISEPLIWLFPAPHLFRDSGVEVQRKLEMMFLEARKRHYRHRPGRLLLELARHEAFVALSRWYHWGCRLRRLLRQLRRACERKAALVSFDGHTVAT